MIEAYGQWGTGFFALAILHTFLAPQFLNYSHKFAKDSFAASVLHLLGEIELVFGLWATIFLTLVMTQIGSQPVIAYIDGIHFTEPLFVFVIMVMASTRPVLFFARMCIQALSGTLQKFTRAPSYIADFLVCLTVGSLSGSFITEPAAMTVTALLLNGLLVNAKDRLLYGLLAFLFVNVSIGGALTHFAAPPILMVAAKWNWDLSYVFTHFGWKSAVAVTLNSLLFVAIFRKDLRESTISLKSLMNRQDRSATSIPTVVWLIHLVFLALVILTSHHANVFMGIFLLFLGVTTVTRRYQDGLRMKESLLVAFFLAGIILFGVFQKWWLQPLLAQLNDLWLFVGATTLTAVTDNAALTYLGAQVEGLGEGSKYALVAGAIAGGGLTIIANAPNAAGYAVFAQRFTEGFSPFKLLKWALAPTAVAVSSLWFL